MVDRTVAANVELQGTKVETFMTAPGTSIPEDHDIIKTIQQAHEDQLGVAPQIGTETWMSDAAHMNRYGIPTVNYGSAGRIRSGGGGFSTHQGEAAHIGDMLDIIKVYIQVMMSVCGTVE
jgi:acetylornithine deacetylase/succinyl-diaminopimelate desuccinylase-like protein